MRVAYIFTVVSSLLCAPAAYASISEVAQPVTSPKILNSAVVPFVEHTVEVTYPLWSPSDKNSVSITCGVVIGADGRVQQLTSDMKQTFFEDIGKTTIVSFGLTSDGRKKFGELTQQDNWSERLTAVEGKMSRTDYCRNGKCETFTALTDPTLLEYRRNTLRTLCKQFLNESPPSTGFGLEPPEFNPSTQNYGMSPKP